MSDEALRQAWFGGVFQPRTCGARGLCRPEVAAWIDGEGDVLSAIAAPPGQGHRALEQALSAALRRQRLLAPARLAVGDGSLVECVRRTSDLPVEHARYAGFETLVDEHLERMSGIG